MSNHHTFLEIAPDNYTRFGADSFAPSSESVLSVSTMVLGLLDYDGKLSGYSSLEVQDLATGAETRLHEFAVRPHVSTSTEQEASAELLANVVAYCNRLRKGSVAISSELVGENTDVFCDYGFSLDTELEQYRLDLPI